MKVTIRAKNKTEINESTKKHIIEKLSKLDQYFRKSEDLEAHVLCKEYDDCKAVEITIPTKNIILRAEVKEETFMNAVDAAVDKLISQLRTHKSKIYSSMKKREGVSGYYSNNSDFDLENLQAEIMVQNLVKDKKIELKPMTVEDALLQMEMLDHKFFIFLNSETGKVFVVYLRDDHDYGIIEANV